MLKCKHGEYLFSQDRTTYQILFSNFLKYALIILLCETEDSGMTKASGESPNRNVEAKNVSIWKLPPFFSFCHFAC